MQMKFSVADYTSVLRKLSPNNEIFPESVSQTRNAVESFSTYILRNISTVFLGIAQFLAHTHF